jgi:hypothetical protein
MRDWEARVERQLNGLALEPAECAEVIAELAAHVIRSRGLAELAPQDSKRQDKGEDDDKSREAILAA